ncbi:MAG TPA: DUF4410 domain-containing protein [Candidatus Binataceae bacterium]|nr:DUF4410 domain-containing protein [Candidatus Binataceae bacterium]
MAQRPTIVLVYDFHASPNTVSEDPRLIAEGTNDFASASTAARQAALGEQVREQIQNKLVDGITALGLPAQAGDPSRPAPAGALIIRGDFWTASPDNLQIRNIIRFGKDSSTVETSIYALGAISPDSLVPLLHFLTDAQTDAMPALTDSDDQPSDATSKRAARAQRGDESITIDTYRSQVTQLVDKTVSQALTNLSQYFANQGWIAFSQVNVPQY